MKTSIYSFYSNSVRAFAQVKASSKKNVIIYARDIMKENVRVSSVSKLAVATNFHQGSIENLYPELF